MTDTAQKPKQASNKAGCLGVIILILLLVGGFFLLRSCMSGENKPNDITLKAEVSREGLQIKIVNKDDFVWENPEITINDDYTYKTEFLAKGESHIGLVRFTKKDGEKFNPETHQVKKIMIYIPATKERLQGYYFGDWKD